MSFKALLFSLLCIISHAWGEEDWGAYYEKSRTWTNPRLTLERAVKAFETEEREPGIAIDLGCGTGTDVLFLLEKNWQVIAVDEEGEALRILGTRVPEEKSNLLVLEQQPFESMQFPAQVDLVNASYSLPFCRPEAFPALWMEIVEHLSLGGRFAGQFFGDRDEWASIPNRTHHTYQQLMELFSGRFEIEYLVKEEGWKPCATGELKYWHAFHIVAKKMR